MTAEISVKDQIKKLVETQKIDEEIYNLKKDLKEKPQMIQALQERFEGSKEKLKELEEKYKQIQVDRKDKELELKTKEEDIAKANTDLSQIKTNKEYTAKLSEIENIKADQSVIEEKILKSYDESDAAQTEIDKEKENVAAKEKEFQTKKNEVEGEIKLIEDRLKVLESQRTQLLPDVDKNILARYEKILEHKEGLAVAPVLNGNTCGGCFMNVTPQQVNAIKMNSEIISCESCTRLLYIEDDL